MLRKLEQFANELTGLERPDEVVNALHALVRPTINVYGAWRIPIYPDEMDRYVVDRNVWFHASVPPGFVEGFWPLARKYGPSPMSRLAQQKHRLMTWTEMTRELALSGPESWLLDLARTYKIRDAAYSPHGAWLVGYWSPKVIRLSAQTRAGLSIAAGFTVHRLEEMVDPEEIDGTVPRLTRRQLGALRLMSRGHTVAEIAVRMGVTFHTVRDYLDGARRKLNASSAHHAACQALRLHLIS